MRERNVYFIPQVLPPASLNFALFQVLRENPTTKYRNRSSYKRSWLYVLFLALGGPFNANVRTATFKEYCVWWGKSAAWNAFYLGILLQNLCHTEKRKCNVSQQGNDVVLTKMKVHVILLNLFNAVNNIIEKVEKQSAHSEIVLSVCVMEVWSMM